MATARAEAATQAQDRTRKQVGQLAGDLYRNGGLNPTLTTFVSGNGEALQQAATLQAISASRSRAFESAETAAAAAQSLTAAAQDANRAADDAAKTAEARKAQADEANAGPGPGGRRSPGATDHPGGPAGAAAEHHRGVGIGAGG